MLKHSVLSQQFNSIFFHCLNSYTLFCIVLLAHNVEQLHHFELYSKHMIVWKWFYCQTNIVLQFSVFYSMQTAHVFICSYMADGIGYVSVAVH